MKLTNDGFTLPELIVVMVVSLLFSSLLIFFTFNYWRFGLLEQNDQDTLTTRLNAGDYLRNNIGESSGLIIQNGLPDSHVLKPDPGQPSGLYWLPIHAIPSHVVVGSTGTITPLIYFRKLSLDSLKNIIMNGVAPYEDEYVLYLNGTTKQLLSRSIANSSAAGDILRSSCPPASASNSCPSDKIIASDLSSIDIRYFSKTGTLIDYTSSIDIGTGLYNGPDFPYVEVVEFTINLTKKSSFESTNQTVNNTVIRIALRNN